MSVRERLFLYRRNANGTVSFRGRVVRRRVVSVVERLFWLGNDDVQVTPEHGDFTSEIRLHDPATGDFLGRS